MKKDEIRQRIETLIAEDKIYEALESLANYVKGIDRRLETDILMQKAAFNSNEREYRNNQIYGEAFKITNARIRDAITRILEKIPAEGNSSELKKIEESPFRKILFLAASPKDSPTLGLEKELKKIKEELSRTTARDSFQLISESAVEVLTITGAMQKHNPEIVHFSGHGTGKDGIVVEDEYGNTQIFPTHGLERLFRSFKHQVKCVLLNACYSKEQAKVISAFGIYVIGMNKAIGDNAAIKFAVGFYQSLGEKSSFEHAYQMAMVNISPDADDFETPEIWFNERNISYKNPQT